MKRGWLIEERRLHWGSGWWRSQLSRLAWNSGTQTQLELRFGSTEECLVDLGVVGIQSDVGTGTVRVTLEDDILI